MSWTTAADIAAKLDNTARRRLERIVELDEEKAVAVLKGWLASGRTDAAPMTDRAA